jgi:hypothetical protein
MTVPAEIAITVSSLAETSSVLFAQDRVALERVLDLPAHREEDVRSPDETHTRTSSPDFRRGLQEAMSPWRFRRRSLVPSTFALATCGVTCR